MFVPNVKRNWISATMGKGVSQKSCKKKVVEECEVVDHNAFPDKMDDDGNVVLWLHVCIYRCCGERVPFSYKSNNPLDMCPVRFCIKDE